MILTVASPAPHSYFMPLLMPAGQSMKLAVVGSNGQLGTDMISSATARGYECCGVDVPDIDIASQASIAHFLDRHAPDVVINCAAYTAVDNCESDKDIAFKVNADGVANLARCCQNAECDIVHISTDYVFDGTKTTPYLESDETCPQSIYGASKLKGEVLLREQTDAWYIFRIAWLYGCNGSNFAKTIADVARRKAREGAALKVVDDQTGSPTYTREVCRQILAVIPLRRFGLYHCTAEGNCTWYDFARKICEANAISVQLEPCATGEFPRPAPRPAYSVLENAHLKNTGLQCMKHWETAYGDFLNESNSPPFAGGYVSE
ncbi:MAG: dTDP-4-dehydrorhamnose reductase [Chitinivibrionales bacterium]|nr:dTDP-4-dehydrorhamnose reductase [Chitinivibrionales bacterium]